MEGYKKEIHAVPQVVELVEELVVNQDLAGDLTVVLHGYQYNKFVGRSKMHLATSFPKVNEYFGTLIGPFIKF